MPESSSIILLDNEFYKCTHSDFIVTGGVQLNGLLQDSLVGFQINGYTKYQADLSYFDEVSMPQQRMMHQSCIIQYQGKPILFIFGGKIGHSQSSSLFTNSIFSYDLTTVFQPYLGKKNLGKNEKLEGDIAQGRKWKQLQPMTSARACFAHIVIDNKIYVFGGISGNQDGEYSHYPKIADPLIERYDPIQDKWDSFQINNAPSVEAFSWTKLGKNTSKIMILGGSGQTKGYCWIIDFKEKKAEEQKLLEQEVSMGKLIYREKEKTVYQIGGYGSDGQNFKLKLENGKEWEEFERSQASILPASLSNQKLGSLIELASLTAIYFPNYAQDNIRQDKENISNEIKVEQAQIDQEDEYEQQQNQKEVENDQDKIAEMAKQKLQEEKIKVPNDVIFYFVDNEILYLDYTKNTWALGDIKENESGLIIPESSSIILLDYKSEKCKDYNIIVTGGAIYEFLQDSLVGVQLDDGQINSITQYQAKLSNIYEAKLPEKRMMHESCIIHLQGKPILFVFGGKVGVEQSSCQFTNSVVSYNMAKIFQPHLGKINLEKNQQQDMDDQEQAQCRKWKQLQPMTSARACFAHIVIDNKIYVFGGISGNQDGEYSHYPKIADPLIESYDHILNKWESFQIDNAPSVGAFSWTKLGKNTGKILILGGTNGDSTKGQCWIIDFKEKKAEEQKLLEQEVSMGKLIYREKEKTVYQIGGYGSVGQNFKLKLENGKEWEEFERSQASILPASLSNQKLGSLIELASLTAIYFPYNAHDNIKQIEENYSDQIKAEQEQLGLEDEYEQQQNQQQVENDIDKINEKALSLKEKINVPNDILFYFLDNEILFLDYKKDSWALGDIKENENIFVMPESSSIILLDYEYDHCKHSNIIVTGGVRFDGLLQNSLVGFQLDHEEINCVTQYHARLSYFDKVSMKEKRMMHESCIIHLQGKPTLLVFGGKIGESQSHCKFTNSVFSYDMTTVFQPHLEKKNIENNEKQEGERATVRQWKELQSMESARACFAHIVIENQIYIFGGISGNQEGEYSHYPKIADPLIERYDPNHNKWDSFKINNAPLVAAFSWTQLGKNSSKIMILGGTYGDSTKGQCWIIDFKEQLAEEQKQLEQEISMGKLIYREKDQTVYQIGGHGSVGQNFKLKLDNGKEWEVFERSQASILPASASYQQNDHLIELAGLTAIYFPFYVQDDK